MDLEKNAFSKCNLKKQPSITSTTLSASHLFNARVCKNNKVTLLQVNRHSELVVEHLRAINAGEMWAVFHRRDVRQWQVWFHIAESRENKPAAKITEIKSCCSLIFPVETPPASSSCTTDCW